MVRQKDNTSIYKVVSPTTNNHYYVELIRLQNNYFGSSRFEAHIISIEHIEKYDYCGAWVYRFTGHFMDDKQECDFIVAYHEKKVMKTHNN